MAHLKKEPEGKNKTQECWNDLERRTFYEELTNITKANAYDILKQQVADLKKTIRNLIEVGELEDLKFTSAEETAIFKKIVKDAKIKSYE